MYIKKEEHHFIPVSFYSLKKDHFNEFARFLNTSFACQKMFHFTSHVGKTNFLVQKLCKYFTFMYSYLICLYIGICDLENPNDKQ